MYTFFGCQGLEGSCLNEVKSEHNYNLLHDDSDENARSVKHHVEDHVVNNINPRVKT